MKQKSKDSELTNLEKRLNQKFEKIERLFALTDEKNVSMERRLRIEIGNSTYSTTQRLERNFEAQLQLAIKDLKNELKATENRLNTRITNVGDLITVELGKKIQVHAKRITRLEQNMLTA